jgi:hypothetical protein
MAIADSLDRVESIGNRGPPRPIPLRGKNRVARRQTGAQPKPINPSESMGWSHDVA